MNLDELQSIRDAERQTDSIQELRESFYADVAEYIAGLREERDRAAAEADDPFANPEVRRLSDEISTAENTVEAIYERRVGKLVKLASFAAADMPADDSGLTAEERPLFTDLVERIEENRAHVLDVVAGEVEAHAGDADAHEAGPDPTAESEEGPAVGAADLMGEGETDEEPAPPEEREESTAPSPAGIESGNETEVDGPTAAAEPASGGDSLPDDPDRTTVRITREVGEIVGVDDREYDLSAEDVVTLPEANAAPLVQRDAAERLE